MFDVHANQVVAAQWGARGGPAHEELYVGGSWKGEFSVRRQDMMDVTKCANSGKVRPFTTALESIQSSSMQTAQLIRRAQ